MPQRPNNPLLCHSKVVRKLWQWPCFETPRSNPTIQKSSSNVLELRLWMLSRFTSLRHVRQWGQVAKAFFKMAAPNELWDLLKTVIKRFGYSLVFQNPLGSKYFMHTYKRRYKSFIIVVCLLSTLLSLSLSLTLSEWFSDTRRKSPLFSRFSTDTECVITGWGRTRRRGGASSVLREARVPLVGEADCKKNYRPELITSNMICAGNLGGGIDACRGDSGGTIEFCFLKSEWSSIVHMFHLALSSSILVHYFEDSAIDI